MPTVAIVADDFGMSTFRTDGILQCFYNGSISQASLMVTGDDATRAVRLAKSALHPHQLPLGLHFNITQGRCASQVPFAGLALLQEEEQKRNPPNKQASEETLLFYKKCSEKFVNPETKTFRDKILAFYNVGNVIVFDDVLNGENGSETDTEKREEAAAVSKENDDNHELQPIWFNLILEELCAQLALFEQLCGHFPFALDGHHHIHVLPIVAKVISNFFRSPYFESFSQLQRRIVDHYLPGTSAAAAVRALRYLRVPLPPLCDMSRVEDWRGSLLDCVFDYHCDHDQNDHHQIMMMKKKNRPRNVMWDMKEEDRGDGSEVTYSSTTTNGAPFFTRITWCAYRAFRRWEENGLFGPIEKRIVVNSNSSSTSTTTTTTSTTTKSFSPSRAGSTGSPSRTLVEYGGSETTGSDNTKNGQKQHVVHTMSPFRRRGVVSTTTDENDTNQNKTETVSAVAVGLSQAIIPRRLCCFASGKSVNIEHLQTALKNLQKEEEELKIRREMMDILRELEKLQRDPTSYSDASSASNLQQYFNQQLSNLKQKHVRLSRLTSNVENYQLYQNEKFVGNEFTEEDRRGGFYSLNILPWATECSDELEIMVHPSVQMPKLLDSSSSSSSNQNHQQQRQTTSSSNYINPLFVKNESEKKEQREELIRREQVRQIESAWYGPTRAFYCAWSQSEDRLVELDFLSTEKFSECLVGAGCVVACYDEYSSSNLMAKGGGRSTGRS